MAEFLKVQINYNTIASEMWTNPIPVGGSTTVGFTGTKTAETEINISNYG